MTIGNDLEQRLDSWMQEDATLPDDLREVADRGHEVGALPALERDRFRNARCQSHPPPPDAIWPPRDAPAAPPR